MADERRERAATRVTEKRKARAPKRDEFEQFVGELMKVDPSGLSGKHKAEKKPAKAKSAKRAPSK
jgi:hypothetical protein